ncbi:hypothetical protein BT96DRAFT_990242 [Gymnopus androsaceus JB14]|uniref:P-loop containing nucleoside triphosphate hydrolase protein n=1 Tax=Gymnopus androsaceus JB14 TaxID=1447944 RepID=A0A6A4I3D0_9AGAR|nr:hypothetical protein BT96DRAFT_990242 [Gymnopus androsaceus JB14]
MTHLQLLLIISWTAICSVVLLIVHGLLVKFDWVGNDDDSLEITENKPKPPRVFAALRFLGCLVIFGLEVTEAVKDRRVGESRSRDINVILCLVFAYTTVLALLALLFLTTTPRWSILYERHVNTVLLVALGVYAVRDLVPFVRTSDGEHRGGALLWVKIALLFLTAVVIPLASPRVWIPVEANADTVSSPNPEQIASPLSLLFFAFLDPIVWKAYRVAHLPASELPHLADSDRVAWLKKRWFPSLELYSSANIGQPKPNRKRSMPYTLLWMFRWTWMKIGIAMLTLACGNLGSPVAVNKLLSYLESQASSSPSSSSSSIRPWFWILLLFISPLAVTLSMEWYMRIALRLNVQVDALITQLVFEHSLRIRVKANTAGAPGKSAPKSIELDSKKKGTEGGDSSPQQQQKQKTPDDKRGKKGKKSGGATKSTSGRINNLVTTDLSNMAELRNWMFVFLQRPFEFVLSAAFLYGILGWSSFVGIGLMFALAPIPVKIINAGRKVFLERMRKTDWRVEVFGDVMSVLRMVKLFGWEAKMSKRIADVRKEELKLLKKRRMYWMGSELSNYLVPLVAVTGCFATFPLQHPNNEARPHSVPLVNLNKYYTGLISIARIEEFLAETELIDSFDPSSTSSVVAGPLDAESGSPSGSSASSTVVALAEDDASADRQPREQEQEQLIIGFSNATFSWSKEDEEIFSATASSAITSAVGLLPQEEEEASAPPQAGAVLGVSQVRKFFLTISDTVLFHRNCINLIIGPTGSGKTAMLLALLGEMHFIPMPASSRSPSTVNDDLEDSSKNSSLRGRSAMDASVKGSGSWYSLPRDSGHGRGHGVGAVAYAAQESWVQNETIRDNILFHSPFDEERYNKVLYQCALERDLTLFDAGDLTEVGEKGLTLSGGQKTRLTLARAVYSNAKILLLDDVLAALDVHTSKWIIEKYAQHGPNPPYCEFCGDNERWSSCESRSDTESFWVLCHYSLRLKKSPSRRKTCLDNEADDEPALNSTKASGKLVVEEEVQVGHVSWAAIKLYATGMGGRFPVLFFVAWIGSTVLSQLTVVFQTWYLGFWASQYEESDPADVPVTLYLSGYSGIVILTLIINCCTALNFIYGITRASDYIHKRLVASILGTTMRWLDKTPVSRVITRATQDLNAVDANIPASIRNFIDVCAVVLFSPIFILPGLLILFIGASWGNVYFKAQMSVKREMSIAKAPVLGHFGATIAGLTSIRAYGAEKLSIIEMQTRTDRHSRIARVFNNLQRWIAVRINILSAVFTSSLAWYLVYVLHQSAATTGFSLNMAVSFSGAIFSFILEFNSLEARSNSLERIENYLNIEQEVKPEPSGEPPAYWPASGDLRVEKLSAKYSPDGPEVLHELTFHIKSGERIGVVGRTGSGKSSLTLSLLRCICTSGDVFYDGLSINKMNLEALRTQITIIPQIPELISGSLRENLDPFEEHDDFTLNDALKSAGLQALQEDMPEKDRITLDTLVSSGGANFSLGQRQIIALARAIVRRSKLLILDEATSAIDYKTDSIIQSSLHRIMVLDSGSIVEFDTPLALLQNPEGRLRVLVDQSHDKDILIEMAEKKVR